MDTAIFSRVLYQLGYLGQSPKEHAGLQVRSGILAEGEGIVKQF